MERKALAETAAEHFGCLHGDGARGQVGGGAGRRAGAGVDVGARVGGAGDEAEGGGVVAQADGCVVRFAEEQDLSARREAEFFDALALCGFEKGDEGRGVAGAEGQGDGQGVAGVGEGDGGAGVKRWGDDSLPLVGRGEGWGCAAFGDRSGVAVSFDVGLSSTPTLYPSPQGEGGVGVEPFAAGVISPLVGRCPAGQRGAGQASVG